MCKKYKKLKILKMILETSHIADISVTLPVIIANYR